MKINLIAVLAGALAMALPLAAPAQRTHDMGRFVLHYTAMPSEALDAGIAAHHGIRREPGLGILNLTVARKTSDGGTTPVTAVVTADVGDHLGQIKMLSFREIHDGGAVYYIARFPIRSQHPLQFQITVSPLGTSPPYLLNFEQQFMLK